MKTIVEIGETRPVALLVAEKLAELREMLSWVLHYLGTELKLI